jgi:hypothetical protein
MKATNLNMLFQRMLPNFAHLVTLQPQSKLQFMETLKNNYDIGNPKTNLFYASIVQSEFDTIRLNNTRDAILFNQ